MPITFCECAGGYFCVKQDGVSLLGSRIEIFNPMGMKCLNEILINETNSFDFSNLNPGVYSYKITLNNSMGQGRFIKY
jgi:hypothetical protein